jgi:hypothetical protein
MKLLRLAFATAALAATVAACDATRLTAPQGANPPAGAPATPPPAPNADQFMGSGG